MHHFLELPELSILLFLFFVFLQLCAQICLMFLSRHQMLMQVLLFSVELLIFVSQIVNFQTKRGSFVR
jgi:hypothetical protein